MSSPSKISKGATQHPHTHGHKHHPAEFCQVEGCGRDTRKLKPYHQVSIKQLCHMQRTGGCLRYVGLRIHPV